MRSVAIPEVSAANEGRKTARVTPREALDESGTRDSAAASSALHAQMRDLRSTIAAEADIRLREWLVDDTQLSATEAWSGIANLAAYLALRTHDVRDAQVALADLGLSSLGRCEAHVLPTFDAKIETADGFTNLPEIIVRGSQRHPFGVMIARGDLAIEIGYQRLADVQEEILWICEAAHIPVVWATQVLERLVHRGVPTRAEITDAAAAEGAECVMLNKGPFLVEGVHVLHNVLRRMAPRHQKKTDLLPVLDLRL